MEPSPESQEPKPGNQKPSPGNQGTKCGDPKSTSRQPGPLRQSWNQIHGTRNLDEATMEPSQWNQEVNSGNHKPSPGNHGTRKLIQATRESGINPDNQETSPGNHGSKSREPWIEFRQLRTFLPGNHWGMCMEQGSDCRQPETFTRQPWNQVQGFRNQVQALINLKQGAMESRTEKQKVNSDNQVPWGNLETKSAEPGTLMMQPWKQVKGTRKWIQAIKNLHQATMEPGSEPWQLHQAIMEPSPGKQESAPAHQETTSFIMPNCTVTTLPCQLWSIEAIPGQWWWPWNQL